MKTLLIGAAALAIALPAMAQIQPTAVGPGADRTQTRAQVAAKAQQRFAMLDSNRDGYIAADEMQAMHSRPQTMGKMHGGRGKAMAMAMRNGAMGDGSAMFDRLDSNRDGAISRDEFARGHQARIERKMAMNGGPGGPGVPRDGMMGMHRMGAMGGHMIQMADLNKDGRVTLQEMTGAALQHFDRADINHDGQLTPQERQQIRQQMRSQQRHPI